MKQRNLQRMQSMKLMRNTHEYYYPSASELTNYTGNVSWCSASLKIMIFLTFIRDGLWIRLASIFGWIFLQTWFLILLHALKQRLRRNSPISASVINETPTKRPKWPPISDSSSKEVFSHRIVFTVLYEDWKVKEILELQDVSLGPRHFPLMTGKELNP